MSTATRSNTELVVVHSHNYWLTGNQTYIYSQVTRVPDWLECHVACDRTNLLDRFNVPHLHSLAADNWLWRMLARKSWRFESWRREAILRGCVKAHGARVLHSHFGDRGWSNLEFARQTGIPHVVTFYGYDVNRLPHIDAHWHDRYRALFSEADVFCCEGPHMAQCLVAMGCPPEKTRVQHLGVDVQKIVYRPRVWDGTGPLRVLIAGTFCEKKGFPYAFEALGRLHKEVKLEITLIGDSDRQPRNDVEKTKILETIERNGLEHCVRRLGYVSHDRLIEESYSHHVFVSPSVTASDGDTEGGAPVSITEMQASGMPVVATTHCDIPDVVLHARGGYLARERDTNGLVECLRELLDQRVNWVDIGQAARRHIEANFDVDVQGSKLAALYRDLAAR